MNISMKTTFSFFTALLFLVLGFVSPAQSATIVGGSNILTQADADRMETMLGKGTITIERVFAHVPGDGKTAAQFHTTADYITHTFVVMEVTSPVANKIGGFTGAAFWDGGTMAYEPGNNQQFLFNLTTGVKQNPAYNQYALYNNPNYGPTFGGGHDIHVNAQLNGGYTRHHSYGAAAITAANILGFANNARTPVLYGKIEVFKVQGLSQAINTLGTANVVAGNGVMGFSGDGGPALQARISYSRDVAADARGNIYIADSQNRRIRKVDAVTGVISTIAIANTNPVGIAADASGNVYFTEPSFHRIKRIDATTGVITIVAGSSVAGFAGDGGPATSARLNQPTGVAVDRNGNLYIADLNNRRIRKVDAATGVMTTVAGTGVVANTGDGGLATNASLAYPISVAVDSNGNLAIGDYGQMLVRYVNSTTGIISTIASGYRVYELDFDAAGNLYFSHYNTSRVYQWSAAAGVVRNAILSVPNALGIGISNNNIYVTSYGGFRIYKASLGLSNSVPTANAGVDQTVECTGGSSASVTLDGSASSDPDGDTLTYNWSWPSGTLSGATPSASFPIGSTTVTLTVNDGNGGTSTDTVIITVQDTTAPVVNAGADVTVEATSTAGAVYDVAAQSTATDTCCAVSVSVAPVGTYPLGATTVNVSASDCSGNVGSDVMVVTVVDTTAPVLTVPADVTAEATGAQSAVAIGNATATDIFGVTVTSDAPATFPVGTTVVTWTATDANGNSSTGTQNVTVVDTTAPTVTAPADITIEASANPNTPYMLTVNAAATDLVGVVSITNNAPASYPLGITQVTWTATDAAGNSATAVQNIIVQDTTAPVLTLPADVRVEANADKSKVQIGLATATDLFGATVTNNAPAAFPLGTTVVTWTATDANGNISTGTQNVIVIDTTAPVITAPAEFRIEANGVLTPVSFALNWRTGGLTKVMKKLAGSTTVDIFADELFPRSFTSDAPKAFPLGATVVTFTAIDSSGNVTTATTRVVVIDTTAPVLTVPADVSVEANAVNSTVNIGNATATDIFAVTVTSDAPATFPVGTTVVTWSATDTSGNVSTGTQNVTVADTTAPVLTVPADVTAEANAVNSTVNIGNATATDIFAVTVTSDAPATFPLGTTVVTWTATDANGNASTGTQNVTVVDTTAPVLNVPANVTAEANGIMSTVAIGTATATDIFGATVVNDAPATFPLGTTTVTYIATDGNGLSSTATQTVTVVDTTAPVLTLPADVSVGATAVSSTVAIGNATATDIFAVTVTSDAPATFALGTTVVTWTATDANGNVSTGTQNVTVADTTAPVLTVPADVSVEANAVNSTVAIGNATATDIFAVTVTSDAPATFALGTTVVTWTATDANGNVATGTQNVTVVDTTAPVLTVPADVTVEASALSNSVAIGTATATDIFAVTVTSDAPATFALGTTVVTWTATDTSGNVTTGTQNVTVVDTTPPALTVPANVTAEANGVMSTVNIGTATATDIFGATVVSDAPATFPLGITTITYIATDGNGLITTGTQTVTVVDTTAPVLTVPADVSVEANAVMSTVSIGTATATDIFAVTITSDAPATFPIGTTVVTWTATDANGNTSTGTQNVTVVDTTAPVLTVPADVSVDANGYPLSSVNIGTASATDIFAVTITNDAPAGGFPIGVTTVTWTATDANGNVTTGTQLVTVDAKLASLILKKAEVEWREDHDEQGNKFGMSEVKAKGTVELPVWMPLSAITPDALVTIGLGGVPNLLSENVVFTVKNDKWKYRVKSTTGIQKLEIEWKGSEFKFADAVSGIELESESDDAASTDLSLDGKGHDVMLTVNGVTVAVTGGVVSSSYPFDQDEDGEVTFELPFALTPDMVINLTVDGVAQDVAVVDYTTAAKGKFELKAEVNAGSLDGTSGNGTLDFGLSLGSLAVDGSDAVSGWSNHSGKEWKVKHRNRH